MIAQVRIVEEHRRYWILQMPNGRLGFKHLECGRTSWHPRDVEQRYCGQCREFVLEVYRL
jgi:hypothetical protein